jgi:hypothetical protein
LPVASVTQQDAYATQVDQFVSSHPAPQIVSTGASVADQNAYWKAQAEYWDEVPWKAVAGQWGCTLQSAQVSYNPADSAGVVSAGYGTVGNCGGASQDVVAAMSQPLTRTQAIRFDPALADIFKSVR